MMRYREIPYNYTSFSDKEITDRILGGTAWRLITDLREDRQTGRSAKMLFEILGDIWVVRRNPYLQEDLLKNNKRFDALIGALKYRLGQIKKRADNEQRVNQLIALTEQAIANFELFLLNLGQLQQRVGKALVAITTANNIRFDALSRASHSTDASDWRVEYPVVVITPDSELETAQLVKACIDLELTIIARGGGTGYTGSGIPISDKTAVINTEKLIQLSQVRRGENYFSIQTGAGVVTKRVSEAAQQAGLIFAIDPTSDDACTIGGNIAMNAGGKKAVRFGTTIDNLLSWKMVLPNGCWLEVRRLEHNLDKINHVPVAHFALNYLAEDAQTITRTENLSIATEEIRLLGLGKDVTNKSLSGLPGVQKEGCDGLITSAEFILHPADKAQGTICLEFFGSKIYDAVVAIVQIKEAVDANPNAHLIGLEHLDSRYIKAVNYTTKANRSDLPKVVLLADIGATHQHYLQEQMVEIAALANDKGGEGFVAKDEKEQVQFWLDRANTAAIASHTNAFKINEDVVIPLHKLADYNDEIERINFSLEIENKLLALKEIEQFILLQLGSNENAMVVEKSKVVLPIIKQTSQVWQALLTQLAGQDTFEKLQADSDIISFNKCILSPIFNHYRGELFDEITQKINKIYARYQHTRLFVATHMHAGDGNVHTNIPVHSHLPDMLAQAQAVVDKIMAIATRLGGVISGEHGIGLTKFAYLSDEYKSAFARYKESIDPDGHFNKGKLLTGSGLENAYTPSLRLLEKEAIILENSEIGDINQMTKSCLRCGKCKPVCATHVPEANLLYSPRDKIIGSNLIIEAFLYEEQTRRGVSLAHFDELDDIAEHCTICHRCVTPCPVNIDFGDVSIKMRTILKKHQQKHSSMVAKLAMAFLNTTKPWQIKMAKVGLTISYKLQRMGHRLTKFLHKGQPNVSLGVPSFPTKIATLLDKPLPDDVGVQTLRQLLDIESSETVPILLPRQSKVQERTVMYFPGCGSERLFSQIGLATLALLNYQGVKVVLPPGYLCCGYPQRANGDIDYAQKISADNRVLMHRMNNTLNYLDISHVITSCGTCIDQLFDYDLDQIFVNSKLVDIHEFLLETGLKLENNGQQYLYHAPCHDPIKSTDSNQLINELMGIEALSNDRCCGESGTFAVARPDIAKQVKFKKEQEIKKDLIQLTKQAAPTKDQPVIILTTCPSCRQGLSRYEENTGVKSLYPIEIMAEQLLGENWQEDFIKRAVIEKVLL